jgi:hypothetical protein
LLYHGWDYPSITLVAAGAAGFLTLIQLGERPERRTISALRDNAFEAHSAGMAERGLAVSAFHVI